MLVVGATLASPVALRAQAPGGPIVLTPGFGATAPVAPNAEIELSLNRPLDSSEGTLAVLIDTTDVTSLFTLSGTTLRYSPTPLLLPLDASAVTVYLVSPENAWQALATFPLHVGTPPEPAVVAAPGAPPPAAVGQPGRPKVHLTPSMTLGLKSQPAESHFPDSSPPQRSTFTDTTLQASVKADSTAASSALHSGIDLVGSSFQGDALRFAQEGANAPKVDVPSYVVQMQSGRARLALGHLLFGGNRLLTDNIQSRGLTASVPVGSRADFTATGLNGTTIVGWDNFTGLQQAHHRSVTGVFGVEFAKRPGALRLEVAAMDGSLQPITSFNRGSVTDAEESRGGGVRIIASDKAQRLRLDGGFARTRFTNPDDPLLSAGVQLVPVRPVTRNAEYLDTSFVLIQKPNRKRPLRLAGEYKFQQIAPLFRSVATQVIADTRLNQVGLTGNLGDMAAGVFYLLSNNNLANLQSVLTSLTHRAGLTIGTPLASLIGAGKKPSVWWPRVSYTLDWLHQFADKPPVNGGFELSPGSIPDQVSSNQVAAVDWQATRWRAGYRFNRSYQDNRQLARENADLSNVVHAVGFGTTPVPTFDLNGEVGLERAHNKEQAREDRTLRFAGTANWRMTSRMLLTAIVSAFGAGDVANTSDSRSAQTNIRWSLTLGPRGQGLRKLQGQLFVAYSDRYARAADLAFGVQSLIKSQTLNVGATVTPF